MDPKWNGNRFVQQRSFELPPSQNALNQDHLQVPHPSMRGGRGPSRSFDESSLLNETSTNTRSDIPNKRRPLLRDQTYVGEEEGKYPLNPNSSLPNLEAKAYRSCGVRGGVKNNQSVYGGETVVRDYKPDFDKFPNVSTGQEIGYPGFSELFNRDLARDITNPNDGGYRNTDNSRVVKDSMGQQIAYGSRDNTGSARPYKTINLEERAINVSDGRERFYQGIGKADKCYETSQPYPETQYVGTNSSNEDAFVEHDYRQLLHPPSDHQVALMSKKASKNGPIQSVSYTHLTLPTICSV